MRDNRTGEIGGVKAQESMFQAPQESLWQSEFLITPRKAKLMRRSWAEVFRNEALPLIEEEGSLRCTARTWAGQTVRCRRCWECWCKEMFDLTDVETLEELEFNLLWHHALRLEMEEAHLAQKTLHNFRVRLMEHDGGRLAFCETTDRIILWECERGSSAWTRPHEQYRGVDTVGSVLRDGPTVPGSGEP